jgi:hypothetical protein
MAVQYTCDNCGKVLPDLGYNLVDREVSAGSRLVHIVIQATTRTGAANLCGPCLKALIAKALANEGI